MRFNCIDQNQGRVEKHELGVVARGRADVGGVSYPQLQTESVDKIVSKRASTIASA